MATRSRDPLSARDVPVGQAHGRARGPLRRTALPWRRRAMTGIGHGEPQAITQTNAAPSTSRSRPDPDLRPRGLLDSTLLVWGGEFGRTPVSREAGARHNPYGFSSWLAGGGIKGASDLARRTTRLSRRRRQGHAHDLHATMLSLLGLDHERLTYLFEGRERRLTDVGGQNDLAARLVRVTSGPSNSSPLRGEGRARGRTTQQTPFSNRACARLPTATRAARLLAPFGTLQLHERTDKERP